MKSQNSPKGYSILQYSIIFLISQDIETFIKRTFSESIYVTFNKGNIMKEVGYARISTDRQVLDGQCDASSESSA